MTRTIKLLVPFDLVIPLGQCFPVKYSESNLYRDIIQSSDIYNSEKLEKAQRFSTWKGTEQTGSREGVSALEWGGRCGPGRDARREINRLLLHCLIVHLVLQGTFVLIQLSQ